MLLTAFFTSSVSLPQLFPCSHPRLMQLSSSATFLPSLTFVFTSPLPPLTTMALRSSHLSPRRLSYCYYVALLSSDWELADSLIFFHLPSSFSAPTHSSHKWYRHHQVLHSSTNSITYVIISVSNWDACDSRMNGGWQVHMWQGTMDDNKFDRTRR